MAIIYKTIFYKPCSGSYFVVLSVTKLFNGDIEYSVFYYWKVKRINPHSSSRKREKRKCRRCLERVRFTFGIDPPNPHILFTVPNGWRLIFHMKWVSRCLMFMIFIYLVPMDSNCTIWKYSCDHKRSTFLSYSLRCISVLSLYTILSTY